MAQVERATSSGGKQYLTRVVNVFNFQNISTGTSTYSSDNYGLWTPIGWSVSLVGSTPITAEMFVYIPNNFEIIEAKLQVDILSRKLNGFDTDPILPNGYYCIHELTLYRTEEQGELYDNIIYSSDASGLAGDIQTTKIDGFGTNSITPSANIYTKEYDLKNDILLGKRQLFFLNFEDDDSFLEWEREGLARMTLSVYAYEK